MRIECEQCRALVDPSWSMNGSELVARCPRCNADSRARLGDAAVIADAAPAGEPAIECPKCGLRPVTGDACARCGLRVEKMATWAASDTVPDQLAAAWESCVAAWNDPATHDRAASLALALDEQPWLARRYRAVLRDRPRDPVATARLERANKIAQAAVIATATSPRAGGYRRGTSLGILLVLALVVAGGLLWGFYLVRKRDSSEGSSAKPSSTTPRRSPAGARSEGAGGIPARTPAPR